jgi:hypothetical protein
MDAGLVANDDATVRYSWIHASSNTVRSSRFHRAGFRYQPE